MASSPGKGGPPPCALRRSLVSAGLGRLPEDPRTSGTPGVLRNRAGGLARALPLPHSPSSGGGLATPGRVFCCERSWAAGPARMPPHRLRCSVVAVEASLREKNHHQPRSACVCRQGQGKSERNWIVILEAWSSYTCGERRARGSRESW